ncbi:preprotein translocase subunit SecG [Thermosediminibacter litoriperuensis]|uniref:Protein-export membrane protein SecG n=1 Tax=Thermosediminibacter litoriperuensis TaxID=291989 RepID=A0A5S5AQ65_9FIRM|nr:preprotein translocase subunit SecG [Thermosediminibacter litoriperuensis]TYP53274.1 preprotein translocase subunit SecG [Thermosediminibacter litoriperuensis]
MQGLRIVLTVVYILVCIGLIAAVLLQSGKSAGLSGTIAGGAETFFGKKKGIDDKLAKLTEVLAIAFLALSILMMVAIK